MKAFLFEHNGEPDTVLTLRDLPDPMPGAGQVLVRVHLAPVHPSDLHILRGRFGRQPQLPASPGLECVGTVEALGPNVNGPTPGTRVILLDVLGTWRERVVCAADCVIPVPDAVSDADAAQAMVNLLTAWALSLLEHRLQRGDWLVQTAAGSTVGRLVLQCARAEGFRTINLVRRRAQIAEIEALGGDVVICTDDGDWPARLRAATEGQGITKAIDCVAGRTGAVVARSLASAQRRPIGAARCAGALGVRRLAPSTCPSVSPGEDRPSDAGC